jgi:toxin-antitoxin system PIN domain toxin
LSYSVDVNILLHAANAGSPHHARALTFLEECVVRDELFVLTWPTLAGFLRISTHPSVFAKPLLPHEATKNIDALLAQPRVRSVSEDESFWGTYLEVTKGRAIRGNLVPDAHLVALLQLHGVRTLYTTDEGLRRYTSLDIENPLAYSGSGSGWLSPAWVLERARCTSAMSAGKSDIGTVLLLT